MIQRILTLFTIVAFFFSCQPNAKETESDPRDTSNSKIDQLIADLENSENESVLVVAHRGDWRNAPENSLQAIKNSIEMGVDMVEIDVRMTKDSVLVLMHDKTIDRTTNGTGLVSEITYDSLQKLCLLNGLLQSTPHKVPTLREALKLSKDQVLINLDTKDYKNLGMYYTLLKETGTIDQVLIKAALPLSKVKEILGAYLEETYFMPIIRTAEPEAAKWVEEYLKEKPPVAFEFTIPSDTTSLLQKFREIRMEGSSVWVNSLRPQHCAGHDDGVAALNTSVYDWFIDHHVDIIQTDRPALLINYLKKNGLHD